MQDDSSTKSIRISAVIPAYNAEKYIARAIDSVLNQTRPVDEIVVIDDGSTDKTADVVNRYDDKVRYIHQSNAGASVARNTGIEAAKGDWIAFLDADDEWLDKRIQWQTELLRKNPELVWTSGNYIRCLCNENTARAHLPETTANKVLKDKDYFENFFSAYLQSMWGCTDTMLIKKDVLQDAGLFPIGQHQMEDIDLWWKIARKYPAMGYISKPISIYHLDVEGSLIQSRTDYSACRAMISRHLTETQNMDCEEHVRACSTVMLRQWMRSMLFRKQKDQVRITLDEFSFLFSSGYHRCMRLLTICPALTAWCLHCISFVVRRLNLRQGLTRKPARKKNPVK